MCCGSAVVIQERVIDGREITKLRQCSPCNGAIDQNKLHGDSQGPEQYFFLGPGLTICIWRIQNILTHDADHIAFSSLLGAVADCLRVSDARIASPNALC